MIQQAPLTSTPRFAAPAACAAVAAGLFALLLAAAPLSATAYSKPADEQLLAQATLVVEGRILSVEPVPALELPASDYLVEIRQVLKGFAAGTAIVVRVPGGVRADGVGLRIWGMPSFRQGEDVLLFLSPRHDGTYALTQYLLGAFHIEREGGRRIARRDLSGARELRLPGKAAVPDGPRDLAAWSAWMTEHLRGGQPEPSYFLPAKPAPAPQKFLLALSGTEPPPLGCGQNGGHPLRWFDFDEGGEVPWHAHASGQDGLGGGGEIQLKRALGAWSGDPHTPVRITWAGSTGASRGFLGRDGLNTVLYNDPNETLAGSFPGDGVLAVGGPWFLCQTEEHRGQSYHRILEADIVTQDGLEAFFPLGADPRRTAEELFAHELGHTLGLGHSADEEALMFALIHDDARGAALGSDDLSGLSSLYGEGDAPREPPPVPLDLAAVSTAPDQVRLSWQPETETTSAYRIERRRDGVFQLVAAAAGDAERFFDNGLEPETTYVYRIQALNAAGRSTYTLPVRVRTQEDPKPAAPSNLRIAPLASDRARLSWQDNAEDEDELLVEIRTTGPFLQIPISLPPDTAEINLTGLEPETTYTFRVRAANLFGESGWSNAAQVRTFAEDAPCRVDEGRLCLLGGRFELRLADSTGELAAAIPSSDQAGYFRLPGEEEVSLAVRMADGRAQNGHFWAFAGGSPELEHRLTVIDTVTGEERTYHHPAGETCGVADPRAFAAPADPQSLAEPAGPTAALDKLAVAQSSGLEPPPGRAGRGSCRPGATTLCLLERRFAVEVEWTNQFDDGRQGTAQAVAGGESTGFFWFFNPASTELLLQVVDGRSENGHFWVASGALTSVEHRLRVTDTLTGLSREYHHPPGETCGLIDSTAFPSR